MSNILEPISADARMDAYYYGFDKTGIGVIDRILSAVAIAGKAYHHTSEWSESPWGEEDGPSYAERIQIAANEAADIIRSSV